MGYDTGSKQGNLEFKLGGYLSFQGKDNQISLTIKDVETNEYVANLYYVDNVNEAKLYVKVGEKEYAYDMPSFSSVLGNLSPASEGTWTLESVISSLMKGQDTSSIMNSINSFLGVNSNLDISADNSGNNAIFSFDISDIINSTLLSLKDTDLTLILGEETGAILNDVLDIVLNDYDNDITNPNPTPYPEFILNFNASFEEVNGVEYLSGLSVSLDTPKSDPKLVLKDSEYTTVVTIDNLTVNADLDASRNAIPTEVIADFEDIDVINILNMHVDGTLNFYEYLQATEELPEEYEMIDNYDIDLDVDLNQMAILNAIEGNTINLEKIDWDNLGLLSLRVHLIEGTDSHNGAEDYIDLVVENSKVYVNFSGYYPGALMVTPDYVLNTVYDLPQLVDVIVEMTSKEDAEITEQGDIVLSSAEENQGNASIVISIVSIINKLINGQSFNSIFADALKLILTNVVTNETLVNSFENGIFFDETMGTMVNLSDIRNDESLQLSVETGIDSFPSITINLATLFFGNDADYIGLNISNCNYGVISKQDSGKYVVNTEEVDFIANWKANHTDALVGIESIEDLNAISKQETELEEYVNSLVNTEFKATGMFGDGSTNSQMKHSASLGQLQDLIVKVYSAELVEVQDGIASIKIHVARYLKTGTDLTGGLGLLVLPTIDTVAFDSLGFPFGLYEYNFNVTLTDAVA